MIVREIKQSTQEIHSQIIKLLKQLTNDEIQFELDDLTSIINSDRSILIGAFDEETLIGMLTIVILQIPTSKHGRIEDVVVEKDHRGKGIGEKLSLEAIRIAKEMQLKKLFLTSNPKRVSANRLYKKIGFKLKKTNSYYYTIN